MDGFAALRQLQHDLTKMIPSSSFPPIRQSGQREALLRRPFFRGEAL
jgi:hypothetical protein